MAPQGKIPVAATVLGTIGTVLWCVQLVPQIITNYRSKKTDGLPAMMMFLWAVCGVPFGGYAVIQNFNIPIQVQPQVFMAFSLISWSQVLYYNRKWPVWRAVLLCVAMGATFAGVEAALILTLRPVYSRGNEAPALVLGVIASVLLAVGLLPPYGEIYKRRGRVVGFNWIFLTMDCGGAFFSLMALVAQNSFDVLGGVLYIVCMILELGIFACHIIWRIRTRSIRKQAQAEGKTFDDIAEEHRVAGRPFAFAEQEIDQRWTASFWMRRILGRGDHGRQTDDEEMGQEDIREKETTASPRIREQVEGGSSLREENAA